MSEMLGNRYFLARQFDKAIPYLEEALAQNPTIDKIKKKLVVCLIQIGQIERAISLFHEIILKNPHTIIDTDAYYDDCPCAELIPLWEKKLNMKEDSVECMKIMGMLTLYCDVKKSRSYFKKAISLSEKPARLKSILDHIQSF